MNEKKKAKLDALYDFIVQYQHEHGRAPTRRGMVEAGFAASTSSIAIYLDELAEMGKIEITPGTANGIKLIEAECDKCHDQKPITLGNGTVICWYCGRIRG